MGETVVRRRGRNRRKESSPPSHGGTRNGCPLRTMTNSVSRSRIRQSRSSNTRSRYGQHNALRQRSCTKCSVGDAICATHVCNGVISGLVLRAAVSLLASISWGSSRRSSSGGADCFAHALRLNSDVEASSQSSEPLSMRLKAHHVGDEDRDKNTVVDPEQGINLELEVNGMEDSDEELHVRVDFDPGAVRSWQATLGSQSRPLHPIRLCLGNHSVSAWVVSCSGSLVSHANATFIIRETQHSFTDRVHSARLSEAQIASRSSEVREDWEDLGHQCDVSERPLLLLYPGVEQTVGGDMSSSCRVYSTEPLPRLDQPQPHDPLNGRGGTWLQNNGPRAPRSGKQRGPDKMAGKPNAGGRALYRAGDGSESSLSCLRRELLAADARGGHLLQFTPKLLASVCWSEGFTPLLVEGGPEETELSPKLEAKDSTLRTFAAMSETSTRSTLSDDVAETGTAAGGDPRGSIYIVMDCIKPGNDIKKSNAPIGPIVLVRESQVGMETGKKGNESLDAAQVQQPPTLPAPTPRPIASDAAVGAPTDTPATVGKTVQEHVIGHLWSKQNVFLPGKIARADTTGGDAEQRRSVDIAETDHGSASDSMEDTRPEGDSVHAGPRARISQDLGPGFSLDLGPGFSLRADRNVTEGLNKTTSSHGFVERRRQESFWEWITLFRQQQPPYPEVTESIEGVEHSRRDLKNKSVAMVTLDSDQNFTMISPASEKGQHALGQADIVQLRADARVALMKGGIEEVTRLCNVILQARPLDPVALLYQGVALGKKGERTLARTKMELLLAISSGVNGTEQFESGRKAQHNSQLAANGSQTQPGSVGGLQRIPVSVALAAAANLALYARVEAIETLDPGAELFFLIGGLRDAAEQDQEIRANGIPREESLGAAQARALNLGAAHAVPADDDLIDVFIAAAHALEGAGQLTFAFRMYQRVALFGGQRDPQILRGIERLRRALIEAENKREAPSHGANAGGAGTTNKAGDARINARPSSSRLGAKRGLCDWSILHPQQYQVFSLNEDITVDFDVSGLDPGPPAAGSLFMTADLSVGNSLSGGGMGIGVIVCSYLEGYRMTNCLPRAKLQGLDPGWHTLTAEVREMPSLRLFRCAGTERNAKDSLRQVRFCVGKDTSCRAPIEEKSVVTGNVFDHILAAASLEKARIPTTTTSQPQDEAVATVAKTTDEVQLPFCFLTLALNAMPFVMHHEPTFREVGRILSKRATSMSEPPRTQTALPPPEAYWEWHVVEGVAAGRADHGRPYSRKRIPERYFDPLTGLSTDGTSEYLDSITGTSGSRAPNIRVHRRCERMPKAWPVRREQPGAASGTPMEEGVGVDDADRDTDSGDDVSCLWRDKIQMSNAAVFALERECLLVQIDSDELWTADQLVELRDMFLGERNDGMATEMKRRDSHGSSNSSDHDSRTKRVTPNEPDVEGARVPRDGEGALHGSGERQQVFRPGQGRNCAYFDCYFFVGPDLVTVTEDGWGHSRLNEWLRAWVFLPRVSLWLRHAPPELARYDETSGWLLLAGENCITRKETRRRGLVFTHYAYVLDEQVRFKSQFYGHSASYSSSENTGQGEVSDAALAEWKALQDVDPPVALADHLTWLRNQGRRHEPRLLATVADRPRYLTISPLEGNGSGGLTFEKRIERHRHGNYDDVPIVPLRPFLQVMEDRIVEKGLKGNDVCLGQNDSRAALYGRVLTSGIKTRGDWPRQRTVGKNLRGIAHAGQCGLLHLVVDGVVFQVDGADPKGIARVWTNVLPAMIDRLHRFRGTCMTLLVRGLAPPPPFVEAMLAGVPPERFSAVHVAPYNPSFGFVSDQLMLSWTVRDVGGTAFVSTLYTQPFWATTPGIARPLLIHDVLPEVFGWDTSKGAWSTKREAVASASAIVTVSQHSAEEFLRVYPSASFSNVVDDSCDSTAIPKPVWATHNAVDTSIFQPADDVKVDEFRKLAGLEAATPYLLIVGSRLGYKNAKTAYRALEAAAYSRQELALVLVGGGTVMPDEREILNGVWHWTHVGSGSMRDAEYSKAPTKTIDDALLAAAYTGAVALLQLSVGEGFGLTIVESLACGCPVVASDIPPFREIAGMRNRRSSTRSDEVVVPTHCAAEAVVAQSEHCTMPSLSVSDVGVEGAAAAFVSRYREAASSLAGGLVLVEDPGSAYEVWRAVRALMSVNCTRRNEISEALVGRAENFDSWQPLADTLIQASVG